MNERIKQLLLEAQALAREQVKLTPELAKYAPSYAIPGTEIHVGLGLSYEKFTELIVKECAGIACEHMELNEGTDYNVGSKIKKHFGVE